MSGANAFPVRLEERRTFQDHVDGLQDMQQRLDQVEQRRAGVYSMARERIGNAAYQTTTNVREVVDFVKVLRHGSHTDEELMNAAPKWVFDKGENACLSGACLELPCLDRYAPNVSGCCCCPPRYKALYYNFEYFFSAILPMLHTGDIVLGCWPVEDQLKASKFITHSRWSHVGMIYRPSDCPEVLTMREQEFPEKTHPSRPLVVQLLNQGTDEDGVSLPAFNIQDFEYFFKDYLDKFTQFAGRRAEDYGEFQIAVRFLKDVERDRAFCQAIHKTCQDFKDVRYFLPPLAGIDLCQACCVFRCCSCMWAEPEEGFGFCSEFIARAYMNAGLINPNLEAWEFIPSMFDTSRHVWLRKGAKLSREYVTVGPSTLKERELMKFKGKPGEYCTQHCYEPQGSIKGVWGTDIAREVASRPYVYLPQGKMNAAAIKPKANAAPNQQDMPFVLHKPPNSKQVGSGADKKADKKMEQALHPPVMNEPTCESCEAAKRKESSMPSSQSVSPEKNSTSPGKKESSMPSSKTTSPEKHEGESSHKKPSPSGSNPSGKRGSPGDEKGVPASPLLSADGARGAYEPVGSPPEQTRMTGYEIRDNRHETPMGGYDLAPPNRTTPPPRSTQDTLSQLRHNRDDFSAGGRGRQDFGAGGYGASAGYDLGRMGDRPGAGGYNFAEVSGARGGTGAGGYDIGSTRLGTNWQSYGAGPTGQGSRFDTSSLLAAERERAPAAAGTFSSSYASNTTGLLSSGPGEMPHRVEDDLPLLRLPHQDVRQHPSPARSGFEYNPPRTGGAPRTTGYAPSSLDTPYRRF